MIERATSVQEDLDIHWGPLDFKLGGPRGRKARAALRIPGWLLRTGVFWVQRVVLGNSLLKLLGVFAASIPVIIFGGVFYEIVSGGTLWDGIVHIYGALYKIPGTH